MQMPMPMPMPSFPNGHFYILIFIFLTILHIFFMRTFNSDKTSEFSEIFIFEAEI